MFEFDYSKLIVIGVLALLIIGPKELPGVLRQLGGYIAKMRRMAGDFQQQFSEAMRESEMQELKKDMEKMAQDAKVDLNSDFMRDTDKEIREALDKAGQPSDPAPAIVNPTPAHDPDNAFANFDIPPAEPASAPSAAQSAVHEPVREVGLDPDPAPASQTKSAPA